MSIDARFAGLGMFDEAVARALEAGSDELAQLDPLSRVERLRRSLDSERARAAAELFELRRRAARKFEAPERAYLTRKGLEQATSLEIARDRASRIRQFIQSDVVCDATAGLGAESRALAGRGMGVVAVELDELTARCARANLAEFDRRVQVVRADSATRAVRAEWTLLDPDRRADGRRSLHPDRMSPDRSAIVRRVRESRGACVKLAPASDPVRALAELAPSLDSHLVWSSLDGELLELALWSGVWAGGARGTREAVLLDSDGRRYSMSSELVDVEAATHEFALKASWLVEPDPAVIRAGFVGALANELGAAPIGPNVAFLVAEHRLATPFGRSWRIRASAPADPRRVRAMLAEHDVGPVTVKRRGHPASSEQLGKIFAGRGRHTGLLAVARSDQGHVALLLEPHSDRVGDEGFEPPTSSL